MCESVLVIFPKSVGIKQLRSFLLKDKDMSKVETDFSPNFGQLYKVFCEIIDTMVLSVEGLPRVEQQLFQEVEDLEPRYLSTVQVDEDLVREAKQRILTILTANSQGPLK